MSQTHLPKSCGESLITGFCKRLRCPMMPSIGFGVFQIPVNETERIVTDALEAGYRMIDTAASYSLRAQRYGSYSIDRLESEVYYEGMYVRGADASTFEDLGYGYGKDRRYVYRYGEVLEYVDPSSFRVSSEFASSYSPDGMRPEHGGYGCGNDYRRYDNGGYYKDNFHVFFRGREIDGAHVTGFEILEDGYAKDSFNVYWNGREISDAKPMSFECLGWGYAKDSFSVYWNGEKIEAKVLSFKVSRDGYAEDAFNTYYRGRKIRK